MPSPTEITVSQLGRLIGLPHGPLLVDVRVETDYAANPRLIPGSIRLPADSASDWAPRVAGKKVVVICNDGTTLSQGVAALLRHEGVSAETLEGGFSGWSAAGQLQLCTARLPSPDAKGRTVWVTRARPKIDRIACPWLIRRFVDPQAVFLFVTPSEVSAVAERFSATPFDIQGVFWSHRGERCTFDTMIEEFDLGISPLHRVATIVRGADTAVLDLAPEAAGLLAVSLGLSRMYRDDLEQLEAGMSIYDGLFRWARDASEETHNWPATKKKA